MRFIVYGAGGIGGPLGLYLAESGAEVVLIARGEHLRRIQSDGLTVHAGDGTRTMKVPAVSHPRELEPRTSDVVALTMKTQDTEGALRDLQAAGFDPWTTPIFCVQNGLANERIAARYFAQVYGVMIVIPGIHLEPGVVYNPISGNHGYMDVGRYPRGIDDLTEAFVVAAQKAGYAANAHADVMAPKGAKLLTNLGNAMGAIADGRGDEKPYMERVYAEARACLTAAGLPFEDEARWNERVKARRGTNVTLEGLPSGNRGSSWQSLTRGQGSIEADFLNGEVVLHGRTHGIPTPYNEVLQRVANEMARLRQRPGLYTAEQLTELAHRRQQP
jgi:2-dehydropantoate 2-reductase